MSGAGKSCSATGLDPYANYPCPHTSNIGTPPANESIPDIPHTLPRSKTTPETLQRFEEKGVVPLPSWQAHYPLYELESISHPRFILIFISRVQRSGCGFRRPRSGRRIPTTLFARLPHGGWRRIRRSESRNVHAREGQIATRSGPRLDCPREVNYVLVGESLGSPIGKDLLQVHGCGP